jgi:hypothetical protein
MVSGRSNARVLAAVVGGLSLFVGAGSRAEVQPPRRPDITTNLQGDQSQWINDPHTHAFYALAVAAFANGPGRVDKEKFEQDALAIFRDFGRSRGVPPEAMVDHLKLIPNQLIQIVAEDPTVLSSFDKFVAAIFGPQ